LTNKSYRRGYYFEWQTMKYLEEKGYIVFRCSRSKPFDLIAFDVENGVIYLIECKKSVVSPSKNQYKTQMEIYNRLKEKFNVKYVVVMGKGIFGWKKFGET